MEQGKLNGEKVIKYITKLTESYSMTICTNANCALWSFAICALCAHAHCFVCVWTEWVSAQNAEVLQNFCILTCVAFFVGFIWWLEWMICFFSSFACLYVFDIGFFCSVRVLLISLFFFPFLVSFSMFFFFFCRCFH